MNNEWGNIEGIQETAKQLMLSCSKCGSFEFNIELNQVHGNGARCSKCNTFLKWLGKSKDQKKKSGMEYTPDPARKDFDVRGEFFKETDRAVGIYTEPDTLKWFPKSQCGCDDFSDFEEGDNIELTVPMWLAKKHDLI